MLGNCGKAFGYFDSSDHVNWAWLDAAGSHYIPHFLHIGPPVDFFFGWVGLEVHRLQRAHRVLRTRARDVIGSQLNPNSLKESCPDADAHSTPGIAVSFVVTFTDSFNFGLRIAQIRLCEHSVRSKRIGDDVAESYGPFGTEREVRSE